MAGKVISTKFVIGDITQLKTRFIYKCIESRISWDKKFNLNEYQGVINEILFWKFNIKVLNFKSLVNLGIPYLFIYSDASNEGLASVYKEKGKLRICSKNFDSQERQKSSTWREFEAIRYSLVSLKKELRNKSVKWHIDNYACSIIVALQSNGERLL